MNGSEHPIDEPGPLDHVAGRCTRVPQTKSWAELGFGLTEPDDQFPDARAAFAQLPKADQIQIMGGERHALWSSGQVSFDDLATRRSNPGWRDSYQPTAVRDLRARARKP
jgi:hypothetical protein